VQRSSDTGGAGLQVTAGKPGRAGEDGSRRDTSASDGPAWQAARARRRDVTRQPGLVRRAAGVKDGLIVGHRPVRPDAAGRRPELAGSCDLTVRVRTPREIGLARVHARGHDHGRGNRNARWCAAGEHDLQVARPAARPELTVRAC
jgi:hypothetical protein